jgi:thiol-disulfide isomerase/thioredoxin
MPMPRVAILVAAVLLLTAGCSDGQVLRSGDGGQSRYIEGTGAVTIVPVGDRAPAPDFGGPLLNGGEFKLTEARGDVVVLNVWGSWCPPCRKEAPALQAVAESLAADGVRFVGINTRDNETDARAFQAEFGVTFPSVVDTDGTRMLAFRDTLPPAAIPTTLVIDREGRVAARVLGAITEPSLRDLIGDVLAEGDRTAP